ncbi:MAG TPA: hypothetical protein VG637_01160 [Actinomycetes bacterium]|nr:hypothetical protein [Actinomycetes bacterium]
MTTKLLVLAGLALAGVVAAGCDRPEPGPPGPSSPGPASTVQAAPSTLPAAPASWPEHTSADGGFRLRYPPGWRVTESSGSGGVTLSLLPPQGDGISVLATTEQPPAQAAPCQPVRVGRLEGSRCQDAEATLVTTTLEGPDRWFVLTANLQRQAAPARAYDRVLASFRPA